MSDEGYEKKFIEEAFSTNWIAPLGPNVEAFEREFAELVNVEDAVSLSSGTAALHMALRATGVGPGDIVLCQSLTFSASANPIIYQGATPVFIDSDYKTWNMDPSLLEEALRKYPNSKAVIVVHLYGLSADLDKITSICHKYNVTLIEDAAESLGSLYNGKHPGTFGDYGIYSFNGNKIITTSGGGMLVSKHKDALKKVRKWASQSRDNARHYEHSELGYNYRMSNVVAGIGRGQLKVLQQRVQKKKSIYDYYRNQLRTILDVSFMPNNDFDSSNYWLSCVLLKGKTKPIDVIEALEKENIESRPLWKPMHLQPYYKNYEYLGGRVAEDLFNRGLCLPSDTKTTNDQLDKIFDIIKKTIG
jgi:dTDP-4-amino-4,6-dideoxygalactose transaminase